jgi:SAM-dependent methyltransferase
MHMDQAPRASCEQRRLLLKLSVAGVAGALIGLPLSGRSAGRKLDVPYEPSPPQVVDRMLEIAAVTKDDLVYDLGSGDGRIVIAAARNYGARGVGIDLDPRRVAEAKANARLAGVEDRVQFMVGDLFKANFSDASVVTLFLYQDVNLRLRPELWRQLKVGTRVVSQVWDMGADWPPQKTETFQGRRIHYWTITQAEKTAVGK